MLLAYYYATAVALEPLFPDLGPSFCSAMASAPLEESLRHVTGLQSRQSSESASMKIDSLMHFPRQAQYAYRNRVLQRLEQSPQFEPEALTYSAVGNISPAFAPSTPSQSIPRSASSSISSYLEVPTDHSSFTYGTQTWGVIPSPSFLPQLESSLADMTGYRHVASDYFCGGYAQAAPIWT